MVDDHGLPVGRVVLQVVPPDREPSADGQRPGDLDGPGPRPPRLNSRNFGRRPAEAPQERQVMAYRAECHPVEGPYRIGSRLPQRPGDELVLRRAQRGQQRGVDVAGRRQAREGQLRLGARMQHGHLDRPDRGRAAQLGQQLLGPAHGRVVLLHVADHQPPLGQRLDLGPGQRERFLAEHRVTRGQRPAYRLAMRAGGEDQHGVEPALGQHALHGREAPGRPQPVADDVGEGPRQVADGGHLEQVAAPRQQRHVHRLRDGAAPDKRDLQNPILQRGVSLGVTVPALSASRGWRLDRRCSAQPTGGRAGCPAR